MPQIVISSNVDDVIKQYSNVPRAVVQRAASIGINDAVKQTRTKYVAAMVKAGTPRSAASKSVTTVLTNASRLFGMLIASGKALSLKYYGARATAKGISANVRGRRVQVPGGFKIASAGNHPFVREDRRRTPNLNNSRNAKGLGPQRKDPRKIRMLMGPPIALSVTQPAIDGLQEFARAKFTERFAYHVDRLLKPRPPKQ